MRRGAQPGLVAILDTNVPPLSRFTRSVAVVEGFGIRLLHVLKRKRRWSSRNLLASPGYATFDLARYPEGYRNIIATLYGAMVRYRPEPYSGNVVVFRSAENGLFTPKDLGWSRLAKVLTIDVAGDHLAMVRNVESARTVATTIETLLRGQRAATTC